MNFLKFVLTVIKNLVKNVHYLGQYDLSKAIIPSVRDNYNELQQSLFHTRKTILCQYYKNHPEYAQKYQKELEYLQTTNNIDPFPYPTIKTCNHIKAEIDNTCHMPFVWHKGKKLYLPKGWKIEQAIKYYIRFIERENILEDGYTPKAPHLYQSSTIKVDENDIVIDAGAAEGLFALDVIDKAKSIFIFEVEKIWLDALKKTFDPYKDKVKIIPKYLSFEDSKTSITLNSLFANTTNESFFIKMDIEGAEENVLSRNQDFFSSTNAIKVSCCTYHRENHEKSIPQLLKNLNYHTEFSEGYMIFYWDTVFNEPFFRKGLVRATNITQ
ncbi:hypothetical protein [Fibrobacter sp. UWR1]|uniref:hypothetical protein n=1 Tax=Fibrobacter sp. UWR1 TaxID=2135645 RepID=UPI000DABD4E6|nr:hypothetical protein [Fibrobacter sp. UWR1]PZW68232.1 methyltransferase FkbM-like protein [Fibrobacter sp. UWR1]